MSDILKLARIQIVIILLFVIIKFIRPLILAGNYPQWIKTAFLSLPNFFEAVVGVLILTGIGLYVNLKLINDNKSIKLNSIYILALVLAGIYVISQEYKIHNIGGNNVYDINDVIFSLVGLLVGYCIVSVIKPKVRESEQ